VVRQPDTGCVSQEALQGGGQDGLAQHASDPHAKAGGQDTPVEARSQNDDRRGIVVGQQGQDFQSVFVAQGKVEHHTVEDRAAFRQGPGFCDVGGTLALQLHSGLRWHI
jgi:hypothetical protein